MPQRCHGEACNFRLSGVGDVGGVEDTKLASVLGKLCLEMPKLCPELVSEGPIDSPQNRLESMCPGHIDSDAKLASVLGKLIGVPVSLARACIG